MLKWGLRALVVDDDLFSRSTAVKLLRRLGAVDVVEAADGSAALLLAKQRHLPIDFVLCDLRMPQVDGIETLGGLATCLPSAIFVLASSADPRLLRAAAGTAQRAGIANLHVMSKPVTLAKLQDVLATVETSPAIPSVAAAAVSRHVFSVDDLRRGLADGEFTTAYQPKVAIDTRRVSGAEALIRWRHPAHGLLSAGAFMAVAQANGLLHDIFSVAFPAAVADCALWIRNGYSGGVSINLPSAILDERDLPNQLEAFVTAQGLDPDRVTFEVTEDGWLHGQDLAREVLTRLRVRGFGLAIDDFGTGYSGVQQLLNAPFNELKIDQGFVQAAPHDQEAAIALSSSVALARQLGLRTVAEGVETQQQWDIVAQCGCDDVQGYLVSRPLTGDDFAHWLVHNSEYRSRAPEWTGVS